MKRPLYVLGLSLFGIPLACVTSSDAPPQGDAGTHPYDASLPDAPVADAEVPFDAPDVAPGDASVDAPPPVVTVRVQRAGQPEAAVQVIFHDAAGAVVEAAETGADGSVARAVGEGAQVSVLLAEPQTARIVTFVGVKNGDVLTVPYDEPSGGSGVSARVRIPTPPPNDASWFTVYAGGCQNMNEASEISLNVSPGCMGEGGVFPILAEANSGNGDPFAYAYKKGNLALGDAGFDDAGTLVVDGLSPWSTTYGSDTVVVPSAASTGVSWDLSYGEIADGVQYTRVASANLQTGGYYTVFPAHRGYAEAVQAELIAATRGGRSSVAIRQDAPSQDTTLTIDPSLLLPALSNVLVDDAGAGRATLAWTSEMDGGVPVADGVLLRASWNGPADDGGSSQFVQWLVIAPPTATSVTVPQFPASASAWAPASRVMARYLVVLETDRLPGYDAFRQVVYSGGYAAVNPSSRAPSPPLATNGTLRLTTLGLEY
jgi:hypothetical protein